MIVDASLNRRSKESALLFTQLRQLVRELRLLVIREQRKLLVIRDVLAYLLQVVVLVVRERARRDAQSVFALFAAQVGAQQSCVLHQLLEALLVRELGAQDRLALLGVQRRDVADAAGKLFELELLE